MVENRTLVIVSISLVFLLLLLLKYRGTSEQVEIAINVTTDSTHDLNQIPDNHTISRDDFNTDLMQNTSHSSDQNIDATESGKNDSYSSAVVVNHKVGENFIVNKDQSKKYSELTKLQKSALEKSQKILAKIRENCVAENKSTTWGFRNKFTKPRLLIAKKKYHILYGSNPKTGSTSFKRFLFCIDGITDKGHDFHDNPDGHYERVTSNRFFKGQTEFDDYVKIMAIRNPIVRLVSAFRDKQLRHNKYFTPPPNITDTRHFALFVKGRLSLKEEWDVHLMPQWRQMNICRFPYDVLIQFEEIGRYIPLIQKLTGTENVEYPGSRKEQGKDTQDSMEFVYQYWAGLNEDQRQIVFRKYNMDFKILGYTKLGENGFPFLNFNSEVETS